MKHAPTEATPPKKSHLLKRIWNAESYALVLALIILTYVLSEIGPMNPVTQTISNVLFVAMLIVALRAARVRVQILLAALLLFAFALTFSLAFSGADRPLVLLKSVGIVLLVLVPLAIVVRILRHATVNMETIFGALSVYLLIGIFFAFTYSVLGSFTPFFVSAGTYTIRDYLYFSFVTLSTLGFGDLVPKGDLPRTLVVMEAVLGQLYLVTVVALLVSNYVRQPPPPPSA